MPIPAHKSWCTSPIISLGQIPRSVIAGMFAILMDFVLYCFSRLVSWWQRMNTYESMKHACGKKRNSTGTWAHESQKRGDTSQGLIWVTGKTIYLFEAFTWPHLPKGTDPEQELIYHMKMSEGWGRGGCQWWNDSAAQDSRKNPKSPLVVLCY